MAKKHTHTWNQTTYYCIGGTRMWLFRQCRKCKTYQHAIVNTTAYIKWRPYNISPTKKRPKK